MSTIALGPGRIAPAPIAARDWLVSVAVHAAVLAAATAWIASDDGTRALRPPLAVPIRWVETTPEAPASAPEPTSIAPSAAATIAPPTPAPAAAPVPAAVAPAAASPSRASKAVPRRSPAQPPTQVPAPRVAPTPAAAAARPVPDMPPDAHRVAQPEDASTEASPPPPHATQAASAALPGDAPSEAAETSSSTAARAVASAADAVATRATDAGASPSRWRSELEALLLAHKRYPAQARRMGQQGVVTVQAQFAADGELLACAVAASSGFRALDEAALQLVRLAADRLRASSAPGNRAELRIPIFYELNGRGT